MVIVLGVIGGSLAVASLPYWLPRTILRLRMRIFTRINGEEGIAVPGALVGATQFKQVYSHKGANGRSKGAALSDVFWYWLSPGPQIHQEHLEAGDRYDEVACTTRRFLAVPKKRAEALASRCVARVFDEAGIENAQWIRLRDPMMRVWAEFYYEIVFGERCSPRARELIVANAN